MDKHPLRVLIVLDIEVPEPDDLKATIQHIDPPSIPGFRGQMNVVPEPYATQVKEWLEQ